MRPETERHNRLPRNLARSGTLLTLLAIMLASCAEAPVDTSPRNVRPAFYTNLELPTSRLDVADAARVISSYRTNQGLNPIRIDPGLVILAQDHANAQARENKVGHEVGGKFANRVSLLNQTRSISVENVSAGYRSFAEAFSGWRDSQRHNANLLNRNVTRLGIAKAVNSQSKFKVFWTLIMTGEPHRSP